MRHIGYYNKYITKGCFEQALDKYLDYCHEKGCKPEFTQEDFELTDFEDIPEETLSHVIYHAEIEGFDTEDGMV